MSPKPKGKTTWPIVIAARDLRQRETEVEDILWAELRGKRLNGLKFRRQHPIDRFVLDFFCVQYQLAVELDGGIHDSPEQTVIDAERTKFLAEQGLRVIRFRNDEVLNNLQDVLRRIVDATK